MEKRKINAETLWERKLQLILYSEQSKRRQLYISPFILMNVLPDGMLKLAAARQGRKCL